MEKITVKLDFIEKSSFRVNKLNRKEPNYCLEWSLQFGLATEPITE